MTKRKYVHIQEYNLTKLLLDIMEIDIEDDGTLYYEALPLKYKSKYLTFIEYKEFNKFNNKEMVPLRPFINQNHAQYLINMFSDINECDTLFEYREMKDNEKLLEGTMKLTYNDREEVIEFYGVRNVSVLLGAILLKMVANSNTFHNNIKHILKIDKKLTESKNG